MVLKICYEKNKAEKCDKRVLESIREDVSKNVRLELSEVGPAKINVLQAERTRCVRASE